MECEKLRVVELFAGVGGFRVGLDQASEPKIGFETVWANQWEPSTTKQHAAWVYQRVFFGAKDTKDLEKIKGKFSNEDINRVVEESIDSIPQHDILTGGFPCQDYSVARPLNQARGLKGKKGVLWWSIQKILDHKRNIGQPVRYVFLENVDRLLKSPASRRGRDFAIILSCLNELDYVVEWRVINAGEYGFPQRRRRTFILGYRKDSEIGRQVLAADAKEWVSSSGLLARAFPSRAETETGGEFTINSDPTKISRNFFPMGQAGNVDGDSPFQNSGIMINGRIFTQKVKPEHHRKISTLGKIIKDTKAGDIGDEFYIPRSEEKRWVAQKKAHEFDRVSKTGHKYHYKEGALPFPDKLDRPSRTIITSEGGKTPTRFKHVVEIEQCIKNGKTCRYRRLTPEELEALCMFKRGHTKEMYVPDKGVMPVPDTKRAFFMGNALVVGAIESIGKELLRQHSGAAQATERPVVRRVPVPA
jgi:DNA (cytosine-5)-methyltransferase 1